MVNSTELEKLLELGEALLQLDDNKGALAAYDAALGFDRANKKALVGKTVSLLNLRRYEEASTSAELAVQKHPDNLPLWYFLGTTALAAGNGELAVKAFTNYQKLDGDTSSISIRLAEASYFALDIQGAGQSIDLALREQPDNREARAWQEKLTGLKDRASVLVDVGEAHCRQGRVQQGVELFRQALSLGNSLQARLDLARGLLVLNQYQEAIAHLNMIMERKEENPEALIELATAYLLSGETEKARKSYIRVLSLSPNDLDVFLGMAKLSLDTGNQNEAESYIEQASRLDSSQPEVWLLKARLCSARGQAAQARRFVDHAIVLDIGSAAAWAIGEDILRKRGMDSLADLYLGKVRTLAPGQIKTKPGPFTGKLTEVEIESADLEGLSFSKEYAEVCKDRATIYANIDEPERALYYISLLRKKYPEYADDRLVNQHGALLLTIGNPSEARQCFEQVLKLNSFNRAAQLGLMDVTKMLERQLKSSSMQQSTGRVEKDLTRKTVEAESKHPDNKAKAMSSESQEPHKTQRKAGAYCRKCGNKLSETARFCNKCGTPRR